MTNCTSNAFGCSCAGECQSYSARMERNRAKRQQLAKRQMRTLRLMACGLTVGFMLGCAMLWAAVTAERQFRAEDIRDQETSGQYARVLALQGLSR